jgi:TRAP-type C4-dicarboxylate transport system permease small subunit
VLQASGPRARQAAEVIKLVALVLSFLFLIAVVWWGIPEVEDGIKYDTKTESLVFYLWPFLAALLVGFAFMAVTMAFQIWFEIRRLRGLPVPEDEHLLDRMPD